MISQTLPPKPTPLPVLPRVLILRRWTHVFMGSADSQMVGLNNHHLVIH